MSITWYSTDEKLNKVKEQDVNSFVEAGKIIDCYLEKWNNIRDYAANDNGDGAAILSQTLYYFHCNESGADLEINMGDKYQVSYTGNKFKSQLLAWLKSKKQKEISTIAELKDLVKNFFELEETLFVNSL